MALTPQIDVSTSLKNVGNSTYKILPQLFKGFIRTPQSYATTVALMNDPSDAATTMQTLLKAAAGSRGYLIDDVATTENASTAATYEELPFATLYIRDGILSYRFLVDTGLPQFAALKSHHNSSCRIIPYDSNYAFGVRASATGTDFKGFSAKIYVEMFEGVSDTTANKVPVKIQFLDLSEFQNAGVQITVPSGFVSNLEKLTDVTLSVVGSPTSSEIVIDVQNSYDGVGIPGLVAADFTVTAGTITGVTPDASVIGRYALAASATFATGSANLVAASALSIDAYESTGAVAYTI